MTSPTLYKKDIVPELVHEVLSKSMIVDGLDMVLDMRKSSGAYLYDAISKRRMLDFFTFVASAPIGANHPAIVERQSLFG
jgi:L-lysine 6-transaminase